MVTKLRLFDLLDSLSTEEILSKLEYLGLKYEDLSEINPEERKKCGSCLLILHKNSFTKSSKTIDGLKGSCRACRRKQDPGSKERSAKHGKISGKRYSRNYRKKYPEKVTSSKKKWRQDNSEKLNEREREKRKVNPFRFRAVTSKYKKNNKDVVNAGTARRAASKINATPKWLTDEQHLEIRSLYTLAKNLTIETNIPHEVDHIIPLRNENVCGLHVPWNLQVLTKKQNNEKNNFFDMEIK